MYQTQIIAFHEKSGTSVYSTPFQFNINKQDLRNFSLFKCTAEVYYYYDSKVDCLRSPGYQVCAVYSDGDIDDLPILSCTKMYSVSSVPPSIRDYFFVELIWPCADTVNWKICRLKNNSNEFETECINLYKDSKGIVFNPIFHFYNHTSSSRAFQLSSRHKCSADSFIHSWKYGL